MNIRSVETFVDIGLVCIKIFIFILRHVNTWWNGQFHLYKDKKWPITHHPVHNSDRESFVPNDVTSFVRYFLLASLTQISTGIGMFPVTSRDPRSKGWTFTQPDYLNILGTVQVLRSSEVYVSTVYYVEVEGFRVGFNILNLSDGRDLKSRVWW